jgi:DnaJ-class molecular chaperone
VCFRSAQLHPDRYPEHQKDRAHDAFIVVKTKADALIDPAKRFAYDRFGPDSAQWKHCKTVQDYVWQGVQNSGALYLGTLVMMIVAHILGMMPYGRYVRLLPSFSKLYRKLISNGSGAS